MHYPRRAGIRPVTPTWIREPRVLFFTNMIRINSQLGLPVAMRPAAPRSALEMAYIAGVYWRRASEAM